MELRDLKNLYLSHLSDVNYDEHESRFFLLLKEKYHFSRLDYLMDKNLNDLEIQSLKRDLEKLKAGQPVQYIIGHTHFSGLRLKVDERALIPRPETEELVLESLKRKTNAQSAIDLCTGSACIALALKKAQVPTVYALELSPEALALARDNAELNNLEISFIEDDLLNPQQKWPLNLDLIVSNPPYVRRMEQRDMEAEVLDHEPEMALFVPDSQALIFYEKIASYAQEALNKDGLLALEINQYLWSETQELLNIHFEAVDIIKDQFGKSRFAFAHKKRPTKRQASKK